MTELVEYRKALSTKAQVGLGVAGGTAGVAALAASPAGRKRRKLEQFRAEYRRSSPEQQALTRQRFTEAYSRNRAQTLMSQAIQKGSTMSIESTTDVYESEGHGDGRGHSMQSVEKAMIPTPQGVLGTYLVPEEISKRARRYDPEADRQRRMGLYAGAGLGGGAVLARESADRLSNSVDRERRTVTVPKIKLKGLKGAELKAAKRGRSGLGLAALAALSSGGGVAAYRHGISRRNQPYN